MINGKQYVQFMENSFGEKAILIKDLPRDVPAKVLDFGCGSGFLTKAIAIEYPNLDVVGYDISDEMWAIADQEPILANCTFTDELELDDKFDFIIFSSVLHEVSRPIALVENMFLFYLNTGGEIRIRDGLMGDERHGTPSSLVLRNGEKAFEFFLALFYHATEEVLDFFVNDEEESVLTFNKETVQGSPAQIHEFMNKYTWGLDSLPREAKEIVGRFKENSFSASFLNCYLKEKRLLTNYSYFEHIDLLLEEPAPRWATQIYFRFKK